MSLKFRLVKIIKLTLHFYLTPNLRSKLVDLICFFLFHRGVAIKWIVLVAAATKGKKSEN